MVRTKTDSTGARKATLKGESVKASSLSTPNRPDRTGGQAVHPRLLQLAPMDCVVVSEGKTPITCAAVSPDDSLIITGEQDGSVKLWRVQDLSLVGVVAEHEGAVTGVGFAGGAHKIYSAGLDGVVRFLDRETDSHWELPRMHPVTASDVARDGSIAVVAESQLNAIDGDWWNSGNSSVNARASGFVSAWDIAALWGADRRGQPRQPLWRISLADRKVYSSNDGPQSSTSIKVSPDAHLAAFSRCMGGTNPGEVEIVTLLDGSSDHPSYWGNPGYKPVAFEFSPDSKRLVVITWLGLVLKERSVAEQMCSAITLEEPCEPKDSSYEEWLAEQRSDTSWVPWWAPSAVSFSHDGRYLLMGSRYGKVRVYDVRNRQRMAQLVGHATEVTAAKFFSDMRHALSAGMDGTLRIWKLPPLDAT